MISDEELLAAKVAEMYYLDDMVPHGIGDQLSLSRWRVGRLLIHATKSLI
jgi:DNA-binding transcriptional regulator LsrR (DeoR family)